MDRRTRLTISWNPGPLVRRHPWATLAISVAVSVATFFARGCPELGLDAVLSQDPAPAEGTP